MSKFYLSSVILLVFAFLLGPGGCNNDPPSVTIVEPEDLQNVPEGTSVHVIADCSDDVGVSEVHFVVTADFSDSEQQTLVDDSVRVIPAEPFYRLSFNFRTPAEFTQIEIRITAVDESGATGEDTVTVR